jgi:hypothetical protein
MVKANPLLTAFHGHFDAWRRVLTISPQLWYSLVRFMLQLQSEAPIEGSSYLLLVSLPPMLIMLGLKNFLLYSSGMIARIQHGFARPDDPASDSGLRRWKSFAPCWYFCLRTRSFAFLLSIAKPPRRGSP